MSFDEAPTMTRNAPGSTTQRMLLVEHAEAVGADLEGDLGRLAGLEVHAPEPRQFDHGTGHRRQFVAQVELHDLVAGTAPVFRTVHRTVALPPGPITPGSIRSPEYANVV